jgi:hypothetical protein
MIEFAEFEPSFWQEDGFLVDLDGPIFGAFGKQILTAFGAVAISLATIGVAQGLSLRLPTCGNAFVRPVETQPFVSSARARSDPDLVQPGYWTAVMSMLDGLPPLPAEPPESDEAPLI